MLSLGRCLAQSVRLADRLHRVDGARRARCELARALIDLVRRALQLREALIDDERDRAVNEERPHLALELCAQLLSVL